MGRLRVPDLFRLCELLVALFHFPLPPLHDEQNAWLNPLGSMRNEFADLNRVCEALEAKGFEIDAERSRFETFNDLGESVNAVQYRRVQWRVDVVMAALEDLYREVSDIQAEVVAGSRL